MCAKQQQKKSKQQQRVEKYAHIVEGFMNIVSIEKTGLCSEFVASYYAKKRQELGDAEFDRLKNQAEIYVQELVVSGEKDRDWFKFVLEKFSGGFGRS